LRKTLEMSKEGRRPLHEVQATYQKAVTEYKAKTGKLHAAREFKERLDACLSSRKDVSGQFLEMTTKKVRTWFTVFLSQKGYSGSLAFDHSEQSLDVNVQVQPNEAISSQNSKKQPAANTKTLSGGEKSFSTVSLLLSLWEVMELPFCAMDEFDVFMDAINRSISIGMLVKSTKHHAERQHIFITPQNYEVILKNKDVRVHKMEKPDRGQEVIVASQNDNTEATQE